MGKQILLQCLFYRRDFMLLRSENKSQDILAVLLIVIGVAMRLLPHPSNFTPVTAIALFAGVILAPRLAVTLPLIIMVASDLIIGPHPLFFLTWGCFFLVSLLGVFLRNHMRPGGLFMGSLAGSLLFFVVTNLGVFFMQDFYTKDWVGLAICFTRALPFFRNSVVGDVFYTGVLFGLFSLAKITVGSARARSLPKGDLRNR